MASKKYQIMQQTGDGEFTTLHPETEASITQLDGASAGMSANNVQEGFKEIMDTIDGLTGGGVVTGVKGEKESDYRKGQVNLTPANIGAEPEGTVNIHNSSGTAHSDIRALITALQETVGSLGNALHFKGAGPDASKPASGKDGDVYIATDTGKEYVWANGGWQDFGSPDHLTKAQADGYYDAKGTAQGLVVSAREEFMGIITPVQQKGEQNATEISNIKNGTTKVPNAGNSDTSTKLKTPQAITLSGDATGTANFDGSAPANIAVTLKNVGSAGTYSVVTTDAKGRVTKGGQIIEVGTTGQQQPSEALAIGGIFFKELA